MTVPLFKYATPLTLVPSEGHDGAEIWIDTTLGDCFVTLPLASTLPPGTRWRFCKVDYTANVLRFTVQGANRLNHFWGSDHPYGIHAPMPQDIVEITCDGANDYKLGRLSNLHNVPQSQRSVIVPNFQCTPRSENEIIEVNTTTAGGNVQITLDPTSVWCPPSPDSPNHGNYLTCIVWFRKVDAGPGEVAIFGAQTGVPSPEFITPSNDLIVNPWLPASRGCVYLLRQYDTVALRIMAGGSIEVISALRSANLPAP